MDNGNRRGGNPRLLARLTRSGSLLVIGTLSIASASAQPPPEALAPGGESAVEIVAPAAGELLAGAVSIQLRVTGEVERVDLFLGGRLLGSVRPPGWSLETQVGDQTGGGDLVALAYARNRVVARAKNSYQTVSYAEAVDVVAVQLYPVVTDWRGHFVQGLKRDDFVVLDRGRPVLLDTFSDRASTLSLALVIDTSGSMADNLVLVQEGAVKFLSVIAAADEISVYGFHQAVQPKLLRSHDLEAAKSAVRELGAGGGTALYDALIRVMADLDRASGRKAIVVFSDGQDERSLAPLSQVVARARAADVLIYAIGAGETERDIAAREDLRTLAQETGGEVQFVEKFKQLPGLFARIAEDLRAQYSLGFTPHPGRAGVRPIEVRTRDDAYRVRCRKSYVVEGGG